MRYLLKHATCIEPLRSRVFRADVQTDAGRIESVAPVLEEAPGVEYVDLSGKVLMPGNVCAHTHLYSALARGMPGPSVPPENFREILERIWWRLDRALDPESIHCSALVGALDAVRVGTTCLIDHHASPESIGGSLDSISGGLEGVGVRGVLCYEITDRGGTGRRDEGLSESAAFLGSLQSAPRRLLRGMVGGHASFTLSDDTLRHCAELAARFNVGFHVHVAEDAWDQRAAEEEHGASVIERLRRYGLLGPRAILAHGVHLSDGEIDSIEESGAWLVHNPRSNLNNSVGHARVDRFGERVALGTDGIGADLFEESRAGFFRARESARHLGAERFLKMAAAGALMAGDLFDAPLGRIETGAMADLVVLGYDPPTPLHGENLAWHWAFGLNASMVESVMINGRWVMKDRQFVGRNLDQDYHRVRQAAERLWQRMARLE